MSKPAPFSVADELVNVLEGIYQNHEHDKMLLEAQLEAITGITLKKKLDDAMYNSVIDNCNEIDEKVAKFFQAVANQDMNSV